MTTIAVTGASGHVGANLVRALLARGLCVRALVHQDQRALEGLDVEIFAGDVRDLDSLLPVFWGAKLVYHAAGYISISSDEWQNLEAINILGTRNVVEACLRCGVRRLVHFNSIETLLGEANGRLVDESRPAVVSRRQTLYARSKAVGEREVRQGISRGLDAVILYPSAIIGPLDYHGGFPNKGLLAIADGKLWALIDGGFDWVDVRDVVDGALQAAARAPTAARYVLSGHWASLRDLADLVSGINGVAVPRLVFPMWMARIGAPFAVALNHLAGKRPLYTLASLKPLGGNYRISHARATHELDYQPRPLTETVAETLQWFDSREVME
ncbi:MAG TPA: NAD-dependent epimerase/dehydratase family protein [Anaerolineae bacterium]|nr:NAD-dependent epimerase/dehydratase family protein [Anaerolineae bacterium]